MTEVNAAKSVIHKAVELHRSFERVLPKDASDRDKKLTEVFLVYRKGSLSVVRKKSLWGILLRLHQFFFRSSSPLSLSKSWSEAISLMAELAKTNVRECQKCIANEKVETGFTIERLYQGLEKELSSIKRHVEKRAKYSAFAKVPQKMPLPADHRENRKQLLSFLERRNFLKQKNLESFINELPDPNPLLEEIVSDLASDEEITTALSHALLRAITLTNDTKKTEGYEALLRELSDVSQTCSGSSTVSLKEIGLVFGDHFIGERCLKENGKTEELAGDYSSVPYARLLGSFLDQYKEMTPELMKLKALFRGAIDLRKQPSVQELKKEIERQIRDPKASSCLLLGGWQKHSICYEIEKQSNGKYAFRVYNKGGGIEFHQSHMPNYSKKRFPCVAVKDIPKKDILSSAFLGGLKNIILLDKKPKETPAQLLYAFLIPTLQGTQEHVEAPVSSQLSGTCTYACLDALLARSLDATSYRRCKFEFRLFLLEQYRQKLQELLSTKVDEKNYNEFLSVRFVIGSALQQFSGRIGKLDSMDGVSTERLKSAEAEIDRYIHLLRKTEEKIETYERAHARQVESAGISTFTPPSLNGRGRFFEESSSNADSRKSKPFSRAGEELYRAIQSLDIGDPSFSEKFEEILTVFYWTSDRKDCLFERPGMITKKEKVFIVEQLFKAIPSFDDWDKIQYKNPEQAGKHLSNILYRFSKVIEDSHSADQLHRIFYLYGAYGLERAYSQCKNTPKIARTGIYCSKEDLDQIRCSDPFWNARIKELSERFTQQTFFDDVSFTKEGEKSLEREVAQAVWDWYNLPEQKGLRDDVAQSITRCREVQKKELKRLIEYATRQKKELEYEKKTLEQKAISLNEQLEKLKNSYKTAADRFERRQIASNNTAIKRIEERIGSIDNGLAGGYEASIKDNKEYWPAGWEEGFRDPITYKAPFLFLPQNFFQESGLSRDLLPSSFRTYCDTVCESRNIFRKVNNCWGVGEEREWELVSKSRKDGPIEMSFKTRRDFDERELTDPYVRAMKSEWFKGLYNALKQRRGCGEDDIPEKTREFCKEHNCISEFDFIKEVMSLAAAQEGRVESLLDFFTEHPEKLDENSWINLFHFLLFDSSCLLNEFSDDRRRDNLLERVERFFKTQIANATARERDDCAANLIWIARSIERYFEHAALQKPHINIPHFVSADQIIALLHRTAQKKMPESRGNETAEERKRREALLIEPAIVYEAITASLDGCFKGAPQTEEDKKLVAATYVANLLRKQSGSGEVCRFRSYDAEKTAIAISRVERDFRENPESPHLLETREAFSTYGFPLLQEVFPELVRCQIEPKQGTDYTVKSDDGSEKGAILFCDGFIPESFRRYDQALSDTTVRMLQDKKLFPSENFDFSVLRCRRDYRIGEEIAYTEKNLLIRVKDEEIRVKPSWSGGKWLVHEDPSKWLENRALRNYICLRFQEGVLFCDPESYEIVYGGLIENGELRLGRQRIDLFVSNPPALFSHFEDPNFIICLSNKEGLIKEVSFPRLGIALHFDEEQKTFVLNGESEGLLAKDQFVPSLGMSIGALLSEDSNGKKKVLLPLWDLELDKEKEEEEIVDTPCRWLYPNEYSKKGSWVECELIEGELTPKTPLARFLLARIFLEQGDFDRADKLLFPHGALITTRRFSEKERELLQKIAFSPVTGNISARKIRLRTQALFLLEKNKALTPTKEEEDSDSIKALSLLTTYLQRIHGLQPLDSHDELFLLKTIYARIMNSPQYWEFRKKGQILQRRICELGGEGVPEAPRKQIDTFYRLQQKSETPWNLPKIQGSEWLKNKLTYLEARRSSKLPFDPVTAEEKELGKYLPFIEVELKRDFDWKHGRESGLFQPLIYLACFHEDEKIQAKYRKLLEEKSNTGGRYVQSLSVPTSVDTRSGRSRRDFSLPVLFPLRDLDALECIQASKDTREDSDDTLLAQLCADNFEVRKNTVGEIPSPFAPDSIEIGNDETVRGKFKSAERDVAVAAKLSQEEEQHLFSKEGAQESIKEALGGALNVEQNLLDRMENAITGAVAYAVTSNPVSRAALNAKRKVLPTINELSVLSAKSNSSEALKERLPELSLGGIERLKKAVTEYLLQQQAVDQVLRSYRAASSIQSAEGEDRIEAMNQLYQTMSAKRAYALDNSNVRVFLFIEKVLKIKLRSDQVESIQAFIEGMRDKEKNPKVIQMIMGAGKTSVLQPILGFLFAESEFLSVVSVPEALYEPVRKELSDVLGDAFNQYVYTLDYDRHKCKSVAYLKSVEALLHEIKKKQGCLLRTPKVRHSIVTSMYEAYRELLNYQQRALSEEESKKKIEIEERLEIVSRINDFLERYERVQIDEIDTSMNPKVIFKYPIGESSRIDEDRGKFVAGLMMDLAIDEKGILARENISLDFIHKFKARSGQEYNENSKPLLEPQLEIVQRIAADIAIERFYERNPSLERSEHSEDFLRRFIMETTPNDLELKEVQGRDNSLFTMPDDELRSIEKEGDKREIVAKKILFERAIAWIEQNVTKEEERAILGACAVTVSRVLKKTLFEECGVHYGKDPKPSNFVARPYEAAGSPKSTIFSDPYEQVVYTAQQVLYYGISKATAKEMLKTLQEETIREIADGAKIDKTIGYQTFHRILGEDANKYNFMDKSPSIELLNLFRGKITQDRKLFIDYFSQLVLPQIKMYTESLSSTPQTFAGSSHKACGYTGTLHPGILLKEMEPKEVLGTDGRTILAIEQKMACQKASTEVFEDRSRSLPEQLIEHFKKDRELTVFIDSGGWLKEENMREYASRLYENVVQKRPNIEGIVYHNAKGEKVSLEKQSDKSLCEVPLALSSYKTTDGSLLTIIAQRYETGTNIAQSPTARALMSVRKNMTKRDGVQSAFRMRKILQGQSLSFAVDTDVRDHILSKKSSNREGSLASADIWRYMTVSEALVEQEKNWIAGQYRMRETIEKPLRLALEDSTIPLQKRTALFQEMQSLVIQNTEDAPFERIKRGTHIKDSVRAIHENVGYHYDFFTKLMELKGTNPAAAKALVEMGRLYGKTNELLEKSVEERLKGCVKKKDVAASLEVPTWSDETEQEVQQEQQVEQEAQEEIETEQQSQEQHILSEGALDRPPYTNLVDNLNELFEESRKFRMQSLYDIWKEGSIGIPKVHISENLSGTQTNIFDPETAKNLEARHLLVTVDKRGNRKYIVLSHKDQGYFKEMIYRDHNTYLNGNVVLMTFNGDLVVSTFDHLNLDEEELQKVIVQVKLYTGKWITKAELECLKGMVQGEDGQIDKRRVAELEKMHWMALSRRPAATKRFIGSPLYKFFNKFSGRPDIIGIPEASSYWDSLQCLPKGLRNQERNKILVKLIRNKKISDKELCKFFKDKGDLLNIKIFFESKFDSSEHMYRGVPEGDAPLFVRVLCSERKCDMSWDFSERFINNT